ncbi:MAG TPA: patatin-like phospholipase family protein [Dehalococcoidia bacterium]|nr:patatin-like phospholipase family protein [Dehalococcoidia bacterium]
MDADGTRRLTDTALFEGLSVLECTAIEAATEHRRFQSGEDLVVAGQESPGIFVIKSGASDALVPDGDGGHREVATLGPGDCIGEMSLATGEACSATVRATSNVEAWFLARGQFRELLIRYPILWKNIGRVLSRRLSLTSKELASQRPHHALIGIIGDLAPAALAALTVDTAAAASREFDLRLLVVLDGEPFEVEIPDRAGAPSIAELLGDRLLMQAHEVTNTSENGLSGARVTTTGGDLAPEEVTVALEWLKESYDLILLVCGAERMVQLAEAEPAAALVVLRGDQDEPGWLNSLLENAPYAIDVAVLSGASTAALIGGIERKASRAVTRLAIDEASLSTRKGDEYDRAVGRMARKVTRREIGLALGSGAARGFAHIGVVRALQANGIPIDYVSGCSIGAVIGAMTAGGLDPERMEELLTGADRRLARWTIPIAGLWSDGGLKKLLREHGENVRFSDLPIPFAAIACDLRTGDEVVLRRGLVWKAVRASVSVPGMFPAAVMSGLHLTDGGLVSPVPSETARALGADIVVAVDLLAPAGREHQGAKKRLLASTGRRPPNIVDVIWRAMEVMQEQITARSVSSADVTIEPPLGRVRWRDFSHRGPEFVKIGEETALAKVDEIREVIRTGRHSTMHHAWS